MAKKPKKSTKGAKSSVNAKSSANAKKTKTKAAPKSKKDVTREPVKAGRKKTLAAFLNDRHIMFIAAATFAVIAFAVVSAYWVNSRGVEMSKKFTVQTAKGPVVIEVYPNKMPITIGNFEKLLSSNFYDGLTFHRVEDWVIQGGDPQGDGTGGPGWTIPLELNDDFKNVRGAVAMARSQDPDSAGSQFYILKKDAPALDGQYAVFGKVIEGMDVVDQIEAGDQIESVK